MTRCKIVNRLKAELEKSLTKSRAAHSLSVGKLAEQLCTRYDIPPVKGLIAGLAHDLAREWAAADLLLFLRENGARVSPWERNHPVVLHGKAGALILKTRFGISDSRVLDAVRDHVLGKPGMGILSRIIFVADFLEPGRRFIEEKARRELLSLDLTVMLVRVTEEIFRFLNEEGKTIAVVSRKMLEYFKAALRRRKG